MKHKQKPTATRTAPGYGRWLPWVILVAALAVFAWHSSSSAFLQDDSYITYRYARNVVRGLGPVFNPGERTEGYTNFLWMMTLAVLGIVGLPFSTIIPLSQVLGVLCGAGIILLFFLLVRRHTTGPPVLASFAPLLLAFNGSFAYWCVSGMETALFTLLLVAAFYVYLRGPSNRNLVAASALLGLSALARPEGAMFMALFALHFFIAAMHPKRAFFTAPKLKAFALLVVPFVLLVLPLYAWRLSYYGWLFPNTFYAKTGVSAAYFKAGIEYLVNFHRAYGLWGLALLVPVALAAWRRKLGPSSPLFLTLLLLVVHTLYVVWVGGDVLRIYRFFVPVLFLFYFLLAEGIWLLPLPRGVSFVVLLAFLPLTFIGPFHPGRTMRADILRNLQLETGLTSKMTATGKWFNQHLGEDDWFGCTTIGAVSWAADRNMVDLLGLTDAYIAHNPENILESEWHWKERNYNTAYVLGLKPKYLYFSTGIKPSAEAERALFLRPRFRRGYYACPVTVVGEQDGQQYMFTETVYKARPDADTIPMEPLPANTSFINRYLDAINLLRVGQDTAAAMFRRCIELAPADFGYPFEWLGQVALGEKRVEEAIRLFGEAVRRNDRCITSHARLGSIYASRGQYDTALVHLDRVVEYAPDNYEGFASLAYVLVQDGQLDRAEAVVNDMLRRYPGERNALSLQQEIRKRRQPPPAP